MGDDPNRQGSSRRWIIRAVEGSLRRLDTDWIDLYQVHRPRIDTDIEETLGALTDLVHQGKVRYIGASTFPASQIVEAQWLARERGVSESVPVEDLRPGGLYDRTVGATLSGLWRSLLAPVLPGAWAVWQGGRAG